MTPSLFRTYALPSCRRRRKAIPWLPFAPNYPQPPTGGAKQSAIRIRARTIAFYLKTRSSSVWGVRGVYSDPRHGRAILARVVAEVRVTDAICHLQRDRELRES